MQENNFETIISKWRRLSAGPVDSTASVSMSGDSPDNQKFKKKEEETDPLVPDRLKVPMATAAVSSDELPPDIESTREKSDEKQEFIKHNEEESKEAAGDSYEKNDKDDYLENKDPTNKATDATWEKDKVGDKVDSVYLHPPPPHKARSTASTVEDEDCGIKCLYYTLQCCDCVLM